MAVMTDSKFSALKCNLQIDSMHQVLIFVPQIVVFSIKNKTGQIFCCSYRSENMRFVAYKGKPSEFECFQLQGDCKLEVKCNLNASITISTPHLVLQQILWQACQTSPQTLSAQSPCGCTPAVLPRRSPPPAVWERGAEWGDLVAGGWTAGWSWSCTYWVALVGWYCKAAWGWTEVEGWWGGCGFVGFWFWSELNLAKTQASQVLESFLGRQEKKKDSGKIISIYYSFILLFSL